MTSTTGSMESSRLRRHGFFGWIASLFRRRTETLSPSTELAVAAPDLVVSEWRASEPIEVPADGGVFMFTVHYELTWSARGMSQATLSQRADTYSASANRSLRNEIWPIGRRFMPHHPEAAENAMNDALRQGWCYDQGGLVSCAASVRVVADNRIMDRQLPLWERLIEMDVRHRVEKHRIGYVEDLLTRWRDLIEHFGDGPLVIQAAKLTDMEVASVFDGLAARRLALGVDLVSVLDKARNAHGQVGLYELAKSYDLAARTFERQAGLRPGSVGVGSEPEAE